MTGFRSRSFENNWNIYKLLAHQKVSKEKVRWCGRQSLRAQRALSWLSWARPLSPVRGLNWSWEGQAWPLLDQHMSDSQGPGLGVMVASRLPDSYKKLSQAHRLSSGEKGSDIHEPLQNNYKPGVRMPAGLVHLRPHTAEWVARPLLELVGACPPLGQQGTLPGPTGATLSGKALATCGHRALSMRPDPQEHVGDGCEIAY